ncbi:WD40 repeat domain-containing protein [Brachybacterium sp. AOP43-C2-M15]|uniref:WD40 repeat domain-containing protein n=1 Tax=Brachybacterium sp. AOP43-C2-M15 TaxID=3457661 RepID=UPI0040346406
MNASLPRRTTLVAGVLSTLAACGRTPTSECVQGPAAGTDGDTADGAPGDADPLPGTVLSERGLALSPDGSRLAANQTTDRRRLGLSDTAGTVVWDAHSGEVLTRFDNGRAGALAWHPEDELLAVGGRSTIQLSTPGGEVLWTLSGHEEPRGAPAEIRDLAFSPDGHALASLGSDGNVRLWTVGGRQCSPGRVLSVRGRDALTLAWSPDGGTLAVSGPGRAVELWDPASGERRARLSDIDGSPYGVAYDEDGSLLVGTAEPVGLLVVDAADETGGSAESGPEPLSRRPRSLTASGDRIAVGGENDNQVMVWDRAADERTDLPRVPGSVGRLRWSPSGDVLFGVSAGEGVVRWDGGQWHPLDGP